MNQPDLDQARRDLAARFQELRKPCHYFCRGGKLPWCSCGDQHGEKRCPACQGGYVPDTTTDKLLEACATRRYWRIDLWPPKGTEPWEANIEPEEYSTESHGEGPDANTALIWALWEATKEVSK